MSITFLRSHCRAAIVLPCGGQTKPAAPVTAECRLAHRMAGRKSSDWGRGRWGGVRWWRVNSSRLFSLSDGLTEELKKLKVWKVLVSIVVWNCLMFNRTQRVFPDVKYETLPSQPSCTSVVTLDVFILPAQCVNLYRVGLFEPAPACQSEPSA